MNKAKQQFWIAVGNRRTHYHLDKECMQLKRAKKTTDKTWDIVKRMALDACPICCD